MFEFIGLKAREAVSESDLESALLDNLQDVLLELGAAFCFEARQNAILIGETCGFVDLLFYHRILKCHVLIEHKVAEFTYEHLSVKSVRAEEPPSSEDVAFMKETEKSQFSEYAAEE